MLNNVGKALESQVRLVSPRYCRPTPFYRKPWRTTGTQIWMHVPYSGRNTASSVSLKSVIESLGGAQYRTTR
jgi:hypothetical protein